MSQRRQRREAERLQNKIKEKLTFLTERFVSKYMVYMLSTNPHAISKTFDTFDKEWREFAGKTIKSNPKIYSYPKRKEDILNAFTNFAKGMIENPESKIATSEEDNLDNNQGIS